MKVTVFYDRDKKKSAIALPKKSTVKDLLKKMSINPVTVLVSRKNDLILEDDLLDDKDEIKILSVISGG